MEVFHQYSELVDAIHPMPANFSISKISEGLLQKIESAMSTGVLEKCDLASMLDRLEDHIYLQVDTFSLDIEQKLNANQRVICLHKFDGAHPLLAEIHSEVRGMFSRDVASPFVIVNSRMWLSIPNGAEQGPNALHSDGFSAGHLKVMIYVTPLSQEFGYFQFKKQGKIESVIGLPAGTAILFQNSDLVHRGVPGAVHPRVSIEVTLMRATVDHPQSWTGHFYGRHLITPTIFHEAIGVVDERRDYKRQDVSIKKIGSGLKVNIGSGRRDWAGWTCFDELDHEGVTKISFGPLVDLPLDDRSTSLFYSSHCFEHLDEETLSRILQEMYRTSLSSGTLILKIPDYDYFLQQLRTGLSTSMQGKGVESVLPTWDGYIDDTFINRIAMMFCGYWNVAYGDHFSGAITLGRNAYHGPPVVEAERLFKIFESNSPNWIAKTLRSYAVKDPNFGRFNHQNAWSRSEMVQYLGDNGFEVMSTSTRKIVQRFSNVIPDINDMQSWSAYFLAKKI